MGTKVIVTEDNFIWMVVTHHLKSGVPEVRDLWKTHTLYALHEDGTESMVEFDEEIDEAIKLGLEIGVEVGYLPKEKVSSKTPWFHKADKILKNGYWYAKINDIKLA